jgi:hypothetical protein
MTVPDALELLRVQAVLQRLGVVTNVGTVTATVTGAGNYSGTVERTYRITPAALTVSTGSQTWTYDGKAHSNATVTLVGLVNGETAVAATDASIIDEGSTPNTYAIDWTAAGTTAKASNYTITDSLGTLTVDPAAYDVTATPYAGTYDGQTHGITVTAPADATVTYDTANAYTDVTSGSVTVAYTVTRPNYKTITGTQTVTITPAALTVSTPDATKAYDGTVLTADGTLSGLLNGETATFSTTGSQTEVGSSTNTYSLVWNGTAKASNYTITESLGTLTVTAAVTPVPVNPTPTNPTPAPTNPSPVDVVATALQNGYQIAVGEDPTPLASGETIDENGTPLASSEQATCWVHWYMIIGILCTSLYAAVVLLRRRRYTKGLKNREDHILGDDDQTDDQTQGSVATNVPAGSEA